jgi:hypothetical protein
MKKPEMRSVFFARGFVGHNVPILSKRNRLCDIDSSRNRTGEDNGDAHLKRQVSRENRCLPASPEKSAVTVYFLHGNIY